MDYYKVISVLPLLACSACDPVTLAFGGTAIAGLLWTLRHAWQGAREPVSAANTRRENSPDCKDGKRKGTVTSGSPSFSTSMERRADSCSGFETRQM